MAVPDAIALNWNGESLSYGELESRSNRLARYLQNRGVTREQVVGIYLERSSASVVAALAMMKAGAAYLPLSPDSPAERRDFMLRDSDVQVVVTRSTYLTSLPNEVSCVALDRDEAAIAKCSDEKTNSEISDQSLAYVIYTSGSTGEPKGVEIVHGGLSNLVAWHRRAFEVTSGDRASQLAALEFDAAVWETWPYLTAGASLYIAPEAVRQDPVQLQEWLVRKAITIGFVPTPMAERLISLSWPKETRLRILLTGADTLHQRPKPSIPFALVNNYGPTECTVVASSGRVDAAESSSQMPSIGRGIDNVQLYVLDEQLRPVDPGAAGELYVGGAGVARGYRNQPKLTQEKFVGNPFDQECADPLYRTGDLVRSLPNGELEFLGRCDEQIKIRGYRIEPNEIIRALNDYPEVTASTVVAREHGREKSLVAYLVPANGSISFNKLRNHLVRRLPAYMVPSQFVRLTDLPVTVNGKIDHAALPAPDESNSIKDSNFVAPRTLVEQKLAPILAKLLNVENVGANDNFFLLGGHSLLGTQLITRIRQAFGVELSLLALFDHPTLSGMSEEIEKLIFSKLQRAGEIPTSTAQPQAD